MTYDDIAKKIQNNEYETKLVYPTYSNKKKTPDEMLACIKQKEKCRLDSNRLIEVFKKDCFEYIKLYLKKESAKEAMESIFNLAWEEGHSNGYLEVLNCLDNYLSVTKKFID
jgi:hypothetical protein